MTDLVAKGALTRAGEHRYARYFAGISLKPVPPVILDEHGDLK